MKLWARERDLLVEQTLAFVEGITGNASTLRAALTKPLAPAQVSAAVADHGDALLAPEDLMNIVAQSPVPPRVTETAPVTMPEPVKSAIADNVAAAPIIVAPPVLPDMASLPPIRDEIASRVAAFKARQARFQRERDQRYDEIFSRTRHLSGNRTTN